MDEFVEITAKYQDTYIERCFSSMAGLHEFSVTFYKDVGGLYDTLTRLKNVDRNPTGFSIDDAPILGLLVRISKLVKEVVRYYEQDNADWYSRAADDRGLNDCDLPDAKRDRRDR
ncbi:hypothetical protein [Mesorhizobium australicum]|uniref:hypothetical protein n=1 Tax=Mesorhizobium australicum TaxID=536018 RepID=UPI00333D295D